MLTAEARVGTERPGRYLTQLCRHAAAMAGDHGHGHRFGGHSGAARARREVHVAAEWSGTYGVIDFDPWGRCTIEATGTTLALRVEADGEDGLRQIQEVITSDLGRFGRRGGLRVDWLRADAPDTGPVSPGGLPAGP